MKKIALGTSSLQGSVLSLGCMRMAKLSLPDAVRALQAALEGGIDFFDHADIYGAGESERIFARALCELGVPRESLILQSKCGIRKGFFDFSESHILTAVDGILERLGTDYLDVLLLHRPDTLVEPEEVAAAFSHLHATGKVRHFGVSNQHPRQIELLRRYVQQPLIVNQLQLSLTNTGMIDQGLNVNMQNPPSVDHDGGILDYCRLHDITIQPWSPLQFGFFEGVFVGHTKYPALNDALNALAASSGLSPSAVAIAWLLRHPAGMQPILGSMNPERIRAMCAAPELPLSREEWYALYRAAGNKLP